jgi:hypothetical protein
MTVEPMSLPMSELKNADAERLGDLALIALDLRSVLDTCDRLDKELGH